MSQLDFNVNRYGDMRIAIFQSKCKNGAPHERVKGATPIVLEKIQTKTATRNIGRMSLSELTKILSMSAKEYKFIDKSGGEHGKTTLFKSDEYKGGEGEGKKTFNKGNVAELIFAAAIACRFKSKEQNVTENNIKSMIRSLGASNTGKKSWESKNKDVAILDTVCLQYGLALNNYRAVKDMSLWSAFSSEISGAVDYANSTIVQEWADLFYVNNVKNEITVLADGETDQTGTKVDVRVLATDHEGKTIPVNINVSLKIGGVGQFGQMGGVTYEVQKTLWKEFFNVSLPFSKSMFNSKLGSLAHEKDAAVALMYSYKQVANSVATSLSGKEGKRVLAKSIIKHLTLNEDYVSLVDLKGGAAINYNFDKIHDMMEGLDFYSVVGVSKGRGSSEDLPLMSIYVDKRKRPDDLFIDIRVKRGDYGADGLPYYRNIFEKKKAFTNLLGVKL